MSDFVPEPTAAISNGPRKSGPPESPTLASDEAPSAEQRTLPSAAEASLSGLLLRWEKARAEGEDLSAEELCRQRPDLLTEMARHLDALRAFSRLADTNPNTVYDTLNPELPTVSAETRPPGVGGYEILNELGRGGMGVVYLARQKSLQRLVALKMVLHANHASTQDLARFRIEAEAVARLQHPNIVQIYEVGEAEGRPFFSLEYCAGGSLAAKLDGTPWPAQPAAQLGETLAWAVHAAHERGIVHRDLKPANMLLSPRSQVQSPGSADPKPRTGDLGQFDVKITDFGLAKRLDAEQGQTTSGAIMGTPSYMAPEQAGGQTRQVGPGADVYALGAVLYQLLTGRPPFKGPTAMETVMQVLHAEPVSPRQLQPRLPRDLETICLKCLQKEPTKRYATARELAEDLRRFQAGEPIQARPVGRIERSWCWCRRKPLVASLVAALVIVISGSLMGLTTLWLQTRHERDQTAQARNDALANLDKANQNFELAQQSVDRNLTAVSEETLLNEPGFQPLRKRLLQGSRDFYERLVAQRQSDPGLRTGLASAYERLAVITSLIGDKDEAIALQLKAVRLFEAVGAAEGENAALPGDLCNAYSILGKLHMELEQLAQAEPGLRRSLELAQRMVAEHPNTPGYRAQLLETLNNLAVLDEKEGKVKEAEELLTRGRRMLGDLSTAAHQPKSTLLAARTLLNLGVLYWETKRASQSIPILQQACKLLNETMKQDPARLEHASTLASCLRSLGVSLRSVGRADEVAQTYRDAEVILKELTLKNPLITGFQLDRASNFYNHGNLYLASGGLSRAEELYQQACAIQERVVHDYPSLARAKRDLSETYTNLARVFKTQGHRDEAERMYRKNLKTREQLCNEHPDTLDFQLLLAKSLSNVAEFYREGGQTARAEAAYRRETDIYKRLIQKNPRNPQYECDLELVYNNLGRLYRPLGRLAEAEKAYAQGLVLQKKLVRENPRVGDYRVDLATTQHNLGMLYHQLGKIATAESCFRDAIHGHESLVHDYPTIPYYARELARSYGGLAELFAGTGRLAQAEPFFQRAADVLSQLVKNHPRVLAYQYERAGSLINLCEIYNHSKRHAQAERLGKEAVPLLDRLARANPKFVELGFMLGSAQRALGEAVCVPGRDPGEAMIWYSRAIDTLREAARKAPGSGDIQRVLAATYESRAKLFSNLARTTAALEDLDQAVQLVPKPTLSLTLFRGALHLTAQDHAGSVARADNLARAPQASAYLAYNAACVQARSAAIVQADDQLSATEKTSLSERYATGALAWLRRAQSAGYFRAPAAVQKLSKENDLACLRKRSDFRTWLGELQKK